MIPGQLPGLVITGFFGKMGNLGLLLQMEGRGAHWFEKVNGILGSGFVNTKKEEVVFFQGTIILNELYCLPGSGAIRTYS